MNFENSASLAVGTIETFKGTVHRGGRWNRLFVGECLLELKEVVPPARFQRATFRLGVSPSAFTCVISVHHKLSYSPVSID